MSSADQSACTVHTCSIDQPDQLWHVRVLFQMKWVASRLGGPGGWAENEQHASTGVSCSCTEGENLDGMLACRS